MRLRAAAVSLAALPLVLAFGQAPQGATATGKPARIVQPDVAATARTVPVAGRTWHKPGEAATVTGRLTDKAGKPVAGTFTLRVSDADGRELARLGPLSTAPDGTYETVVPGSVTKGVRPARTQHVAEIAARPVDIRAGELRAAQGSAAVIRVAAVPPTGGVELVNDFTSAVGWVKPGETYPFRILVRNYTADDVTGVEVTVPPAENMRFVSLRAPAGDPAVIGGGTITWTIGELEGTDDPALPTTKTLVVQARADSTAENPEIVWQDLSTVATMASSAGERTSTSHGPKVIPPDDLYNTARFGDRPFPVVPVDYFNDTHDPELHPSSALEKKINDPGTPGSTFNLFQENSFGQLYPHATIPSVGVPSRGWPEGKFFEFTDPKPQGGCVGDGPITRKEVQNTAVYPERITDGWYQLPGTLHYYGLDKYGFQAAFLAANAGQMALFDIDSACGPAAKAVYDAAVIADPEINYSDFDTDKDGVVDFFMMVFAGEGGHGGSVTQGKDNIWPHSSSLEFSYTDTATGLSGYITEDQLHDLEGRPLWYTNEERVAMTTDDKGDALKVFVRVGPYNVNPESAISKASVISHEYGHSLGLPDFYSTGDRETYGDWNLMATDKSQHMDVFSKQDMGWIVPRVLPKGTHTVSGWRDSKRDTNRIDWVTPDGEPYTISKPEVANGEAYTVKLKGRQLISPEKVEQGASPTHVWWSGSGNDFGCSPTSAHNFDIYLPELENVAPGTPIELSFASYWDIEWDYDYGFVLISKDNGRNYLSVASEEGYTTPATQNPNTNNCQTKYGNGITGTSGSYAAGTAPVDRTAAIPGQSQYPDGPFLQDRYNISALAGTKGVVRFSYSTDPGLAHPGWFVDNLKVTAGGETIYGTDFEDLNKDRARVFNGGCQDQLRVASKCTKGWQYVASDADATADHGYYLEMRDRSGFDEAGRNENDRAAIGFAPGMLLVYTDEAHGYGNAGTDDPPAQSPLDAHPVPKDLTPNLNDAAFTAGERFADTGWVDNYEDPSTESENWEFSFNCLDVKVNSISGDDIGPEDIEVGEGGDLVGSATFKTTSNCAPFNYGYAGAMPNTAPVAAIAVKPRTGVVGKRVTFDGSQSYDDRQASPDLTYAWDFGDGTTGTGRTTSHVYSSTGSFTVTLKVTDADGLVATTKSSVTIGARQERQEPPTQGGGPGRAPTTPNTGGSELFALLAVLGSAVAVLLRRRAARGAA